MAEGVIWPKSRLRGAGVIVAGVVMKLISTTHFLWAGLAMIITRFVRLPGGGVIGSAFALKLLGLADEEALTVFNLRRRPISGRQI